MFNNSAIANIELFSSTGWAFALCYKRVDSKAGVPQKISPLHTGNKKYAH